MHPTRLTTGPAPTRKTGWLICAAIGLSAAVAAAVGYCIYACGSIPAGIIWPVMAAALFMFLPPDIPIGFLMFASVAAVAAREASAHRFIGTRMHGVAILLPTACLLAANAVAALIDANMKCSLGLWK